MKIVHATWEKRNLGCEAYEITLDRKDLSDFDKTYTEIEAQNFKDAYVVVKMPVGDLKALHKLEDEGFRFLETQLFIKDHFEPLESTRALQDSVENVERIFVEKTEEKWEEVISKITPAMFLTDRISLDPILSPEIACLRYKNWCRDLLHNPRSEMWVLRVCEDIVSFGIDILDEKNSISDGIIGGVFEDFKEQGYGILQVFTSEEKTVPCRTVISSNNLSVLRLYQTFGRIIYKECYVLRKQYT